MNSPSIDEIQAIRKAQSQFFDSGKTRSLDFRIDSLRKLEGALQSRESQILDALNSDLGKPDLEAFVAEFHFVISEIRLFRKQLKRWAKPEKAKNPFYFWPAKSEIRREPFGCTLVIGPWNYPVQLALSPLIAAVAAGNCVILKPSEIAPATSALLAELITETFDPAHVTTVEGDAAISQALLNESFDLIFYTGSEAVGKIVAKAAAENLTPTILELGGKCPCVVAEDSDLDMAAERITSAKFFNAGQTCFAPDFVVAHDSIADSLSKKIGECVTRFYSENPTSDLAKIVNQSHYDRLSAIIEKSENVITIGEDDPSRLHLAPRVVKRADWDSAAMESEIFGPVLPILSYSKPDGLISGLRELSSPLALYLFTRDIDFAESLMAAIPSGTVCINDLMKQSSNFNLPFGGVGQSGMGRYRGRFGFEAFTYQKSVTRRYFCKDPFAVHPPYEGELAKLKRVLK